MGDAVDLSFGRLHDFRLGASRPLCEGEAGDRRGSAGIAFPLSRSRLNSCDASDGRAGDALRLPRRPGRRRHSIFSVTLPFLTIASDVAAMAVALAFLARLSAPLTSP